MKGNMTPAPKETVIAYLEKDHEKLSNDPISVLADVVRWVDKLLGVFIVLEPIKGPQIGQSGGSTNVVNLLSNFLPKIISFSF